MEAKKIGSNAPTCPLPARLQVGGKSQVTTFMQGKPIMCTVEGSGQCYDYSFSSDAWSPSFVLDLMGAAASETLLDENNWWITGGSGRPNMHHNMTVVYEGTNLTPSPDLPRSAAAHSVLKVNATDYFLAGGKSAEGTTERRAHLLELGTGTWTELPDMQRARLGHGCHMFGDLSPGAGGIRCPRKPPRCSPWQPRLGPIAPTFPMASTTAVAAPVWATPRPISTSSVGLEAFSCLKF